MNKNATNYLFFYYSLFSKYLLDVNRKYQTEKFNDHRIQPIDGKEYIKVVG